MSRAQRLLDLLQLLRRHRYPVSGAALAAELGISLRSIYRDIAALQAQGAEIDGAPGLGYVLKPGFTLPPLMFSQEQIEALVLGSRWVAARSGDARLAVAAADALAKISAVLPEALRRELDASTLLIAGGGAAEAGNVDLGTIREAIRAEHKLDIDYRDEKGAHSTRTIWPLALGYFERVRIVVAWCEKRQDLRHFRADRIVTLSATGQRYPRRRHVLLREWRERQDIAAR